MDLLNSQIQHQINSSLTETRLGRMNNKLDNITNQANHALETNGKLTKQQKMDKLDKTAKEFEAIFFQQILDAMDKTVSREDSMFYGGHGEKVFRGLFNQEVAKSMTNRPGGSGLGLAQTIYQQMSRIIEAQEVNPSENVQNGTTQVSG